MNESTHKETKKQVNLSETEKLVEKKHHNLVWSPAWYPGRKYKTKDPLSLPPTQTSMQTPDDWVHTSLFRTYGLLHSKFLNYHEDKFSPFLFYREDVQAILRFVYRLDLGLCRMSESGFRLSFTDAGATDTDNWEGNLDFAQVQFPVLSLARCPAQLQLSIVSCSKTILTQGSQGPGSGADKSLPFKQVEALTRNVCFLRWHLKSWETICLSVRPDGSFISVYCIWTTVLPILFFGRWKWEGSRLNEITKKTNKF